MNYFDQPGLSVSGMKDLAISPLRYWHLHLNPNRPTDEDTPATLFGSALHCSVLEPDQFVERYTPELRRPKDCLVTVEDLKAYLANEHGIKAKGTLKRDIIAQVRLASSSVPIWDEMESLWRAGIGERKVLKLGEWDRLQGCLASLRSEPYVASILESGKAEVPMFARDYSTGVLLKAKMDWVQPDCTWDLKSFTTKAGRSVDESINAAIWFEKYHWTARFYTHVRTLLASPTKFKPSFGLIFIESEAPYECRIRMLRDVTTGIPNMYWDRARQDTDALIQLYADCMAQFGAEKPWRDEQQPEPLTDGEIPQLGWL